MANHGFFKGGNMEYILFDLDGTLMDFNMGEKKAFIDTIYSFTNKIPTDLECKEFSIINERLFNEFAKGNMKRIEFQQARFKEITDYMNLKADIEKFNEYYVKSLKYQADLYSDVLDILNYLKGKYKLFIASNGMDSVQRKRLEIAGILDYFDGLYISEVIGHNKPDLEFFEYIFKDLNDYDKDKYVIIGDRYDTDIIGGINAKINTILISRDKKEKDSIQSLEELKNIL